MRRRVEHWRHYPHGKPGPFMEFGRSWLQPENWRDRLRLWWSNR